ncbi:radical SAM protein [Ruminococcus sp.]|uniref:radical SAM protein n=1 Tax=Ruminococcus sp. TaxID=41978 RepID=UPI00388F36E5
MIETMVFPCTYKCNAKCIMCSIHERKNGDLSVREFERFFSDKRLNNLKSINITGGEPTLRADLPELIEMILHKCPLINEILINTNGLLPDLIYSQVERILKLLCDNIKLWVFVSLDALDDKAEYIRGVSKAGEKACETIEKLKKLKNRFDNVDISVSCTITSANFNRLQAIYDYANKQGIRIDFIYATINSAYINSVPKADNFVMDEQQKKYVADFLESITDYSNVVSSKAFITRMVKRLRGEKLTKQCILREGRGILLEADGVVRPCGMDDELLLGHIRDKDYSWLDDIPGIIKKDICSKCDTDSYYNWTEEAQKTIAVEMLEVVKKNRNV